MVQASRQRVRQELIRDPYTVVPHVFTYAGKWNAVNKTYAVYFDEALRDSQASTLAMRRDFFIHNLLRHRQLPVVCLPWTVVVDDPEHPDQKEIGATVEAIIRSIPRLRTLKLYLLEALFYGKFGSQIQLGPRRVRGNVWNTIVRHIPVNGDKLRFHWDGTPGIAIYNGSVNDREDGQTAFLHTYADFIESTQLGKALFLRSDYLRDRFIIHEFEPSDTDYLFEIDESLSVHGLGLRSRSYWMWNMRTEVLSWLFDALQRVGVNGMLYGFYDQGNVSARDATLTALKELVDKNIAVFPTTGGLDGAKDIIQKIDPASVGYDVMLQFIAMLEDIMRQGYLGQDLSSQSGGGGGLGQGTAGLHADVRADFMETDANMLDETLTQDVLIPHLKYNKFMYEGKEMYGIDLPFSMRVESQVDRVGSESALNAAKTLFDMGVDLDEDDLLDKANLIAPKKPERAVINHMLKQQEHQANASGEVADIMGAVNGRMKGMDGSQNDRGQAAPSAPSRMAHEEPEEAVVLAGKLYRSSSGWGLLKVPNDLVRGLFAAIRDEGKVSLPPQDSDAGTFRLNAHISVLRPEEIEEAGGHETIEEWGQHFAYQIGPIKTVSPKDWDGMDQVYFVDVESPELESLREKYGLSKLPNKGKYRFHITCAVKPSEWDERYRFAHAGDAGDCGHDPDGDFSLENTCAALHGSVREIERNPGVYNMSSRFRSRITDRLAQIQMAQQDGESTPEMDAEGAEIEQTLSVMRSKQDPMYDRMHKDIKRQDLIKDAYERLHILEKSMPHTSERRRIEAARKGMEYAYSMISRGEDARQELGWLHGTLRLVVRNLRDTEAREDAAGAHAAIDAATRLARAGDPDDCGHHPAGHERAGEFNEGNTCASRRGQSGGAPARTGARVEQTEYDPTWGGRVEAPEAPAAGEHETPTSTRDAHFHRLDHNIWPRAGEWFDWVDSLPGTPEGRWELSDTLRRMEQGLYDGSPDLEGGNKEVAMDYLRATMARDDDSSWMGDRRAAKPGPQMTKDDGGVGYVIKEPGEFADASAAIFGRRIDPSELSAMSGVRAMARHFPGGEVVVRTGHSHAEGTPTIRLAYEKSGVSLARTIRTTRDGKKYVYNDLFAIEDSSSHGSGIGVDVFSSQVDGAIAAGMAKIKCFAAGSYSTLDGNEVGDKWAGYYVWPRFGYDAEVPFDQMADTDTDALARLLGRDVMGQGGFRISELMGSKEGRAWWKRWGGDVDVEFDLAEGSTSRRVLSEYRKEKGLDPTDGPNRFRSDDVRRLTHAGDANDCGHERQGGEFAEGNTCAGEGGGGSTATAPASESPADIIDYNSEYAELLENKKYKAASKEIFGKVLSPRKLLSIFGTQAMDRLAGEHLPVEVTPAYAPSKNPRLPTMAAIMAEADADAVQYGRKVYKTTKGEVVVYNDHFFINEDSLARQGEGLRVFADQVQAAIHAGVNRIECTAAGDYRKSQLKGREKMNGYYTWPRFGYDGAIDPVWVGQHEKGLEALGIGRDEHDGLMVSRLMETAEGRDYWRRHGEAIGVSFDLAEGSRSRQVLSEYLKERGLVPADGPNRFRASEDAFRGEL